MSKLTQIGGSLKKYLSKENFEKLSINQWNDIVSDLLSGVYTIRNYKFNPRYIYRARKNFEGGEPIEFFEYTSDIWAPDPLRVKKILQGRCNTKDVGMLYCTTEQTTTIFEISPSSGTEVTIIEYMLTQNLEPLAIVNVEEIMKISEDYLKIFGNHYNERNKQAIDLDKNLSLILKMKEADAWGPNIYNLTNAVTQIFLNDQKSEIFPDHYKAKRMIGLIYPSVRSEIVLGCNIVLKPEDVEGILKPENVYKYKILHKHNEHWYEILLTHRSSRIHGNGGIEWVEVDSKVEHITDLPVQDGKIVWNQ